MTCIQCNEDLTLCICDDIEERLDKLAESPYVAVNVPRIKAERFLNKFEIERRRKEAKPNEQA